MRKFAATLVVVTATAVPIVAFGPAPAALAGPLCQDVSTSGTVLGSHEVGPRCIAYNGANLCQTETAGLSPSALVTVKVCIPAPLLAGDAGGLAGDA